MSVAAWTAVIVTTWVALGVLVGYGIGRAVRLGRKRGERS